MSYEKLISESQFEVLSDFVFVSWNPIRGTVSLPDNNDDNITMYIKPDDSDKCTELLNACECVCELENECVIAIPNQWMYDLESMLRKTKPRS